MGKLSTAILLSTAFFVGCAEPPPPQAPKRPPPSAEQAGIPDGALDRGTLEVVLRHGPPWLLERVPVEEVVEGDKFVGWRVQELPLEWRGIALQAGDVVTSVNAMPVETPNDFWAAWTSLSVASELKIAYLREGDAKEMSIPIYGQPSTALANDLQKRPDKKTTQESPVGSTEDRAPRKKKESITIESHERPLSDTNTDWSDQPY